MDRSVKNSSTSQDGEERVDPSLTCLKADQGSDLDSRLLSGCCVEQDQGARQRRGG